MNYNLQLIKQNLSDYIIYGLYLLSLKETWWSWMKRKILNDIIKTNNINIFVESWTYLWETVSYFRGKIKKIISIELSKDLAKFNQTRYDKCRNIDILQWDSGKLLPSIVENLEGRALFFLDRHYSGWFTAKGFSDCPLIQEIKWISESNIKNHIIVIDDYRLIWNDKDCPTLNELVKTFSIINPDYKYRIDRDLLIFYT